MTLARQANAAWDRKDFDEFDRLRDLDEAIRNTPTEELEAVLAKPVDQSRNHAA
ncbi:hypothetical protein [Caulobacter sp. FWC2]|uniref:hypothetical protein n=1 Tax=Caulobacter sp. FWC2 TaxID=69664 RepID=UPI0013044C9D|nr:hypothetical protein [Caulobacter sp. FWC2]